MNDRNVLECKFHTDMVPYMYGELPAVETSVFESHLPDCPECTDEFASISNARYEVYDWKKLEFDKLATPVFEIPYGEETAVSPASSWTEKMRAAFARSWAIPSVAFAGLAVVAILAALFVSSPENGPEIAKEIDDSNTTAIDRPVATDSKNDGTISQNEIKSEDLGEPDPRPVRAPAPDPAKQRHVVRHAKLTQPRATEKKQTSARNEQKSVPRLNEFADDEDTSLRLAELFEDIDTSE